MQIQANLNLHWYAPDSWVIAPARDGFLFSLPPHLGAQLFVEAVFQVEIPDVVTPLNRVVIEITLDGRPTVMLVPVMLLNGNFLPNPRS